MKTKSSTKNKVEALWLSQQRLGFEWHELPTSQHLAGVKHSRIGIRLNHNETLVSDKKLVQKGIRLNQNETLVSDDSQLVN